MANRIRVGTRGSRLALAQTEIVVGSLRSVRGDIELQVVTVKTLGDVTPPSGRTEYDGKSAFTGALEESLLDGSIDVAVHSMKDLPGELGQGLVIAAVPPRGDPRDAFISSTGQSFGATRRGGRIGTSSVRRKSQLLALRNDFDVVDIHGNVETRLKRMTEDGLDGIVLAAAGLHRLGIGDRVTEYFEPQEMIPASCQGSIAVEAKKSRPDLLSLMAAIEDTGARKCAEAEREFSRRLGGDCYVPLGAYASIQGDTMKILGMLASPDGTRVIRAEEAGSASEGLELGAKLAETALSMGGDRILEELRS